MIGEPLIRFKDASLGYRGRAVLAGVDLEVPAGAFLGIFGENGSGKTTIIKAVLGLNACLSGRCVARASDGGPPRFGYVPQKERLDPIYPLTAFAVAAMGTYRRVDLWRRLRGRGDDEVVLACLESCGAAALAGARFSDLSGGQKQRVLIARALTADPEVLVLDEPLAGIDITTQHALLELLRVLKLDRRLTVLMVSHRLQAERDLFTHIAWVDRRRVLMGPAEQMLTSGRFSEVFRTEL